VILSKPALRPQFVVLKVNKTVLVLPNNAWAAFSAKSLTLHHVTDASDLIGSFPQQGSGVVDTDDNGGTSLCTFR